VLVLHWGTVPILFQSRGAPWFGVLKVYSWAEIFFVMFLHCAGGKRSPFVVIGAYFSIISHLLRASFAGLTEGLRKHKNHTEQMLCSMFGFMLLAHFRNKLTRNWIGFMLNHEYFLLEVVWNIYFFFQQLTHWFHVTCWILLAWKVLSWLSVVKGYWIKVIFLVLLCGIIVSCFVAILLWQYCILCWRANVSLPPR